MVFAPSVSPKTWTHHLFNNFRPLQDREKSCRSDSNHNNNSSRNDDDDHNNSNNNNNNNHDDDDDNNKNKNKKKKKKNKSKHKHKHKHKNVWLDGYKLRYEKNVALCSAPARTRPAHEQHQRSHYYI